MFENIDTPEKLLIAFVTLYIYLCLSVLAVILAFSVIGDIIVAFKRWRAKRTASRE